MKTTGKSLGSRTTSAPSAATSTAFPSRALRTASTLFGTCPPGYVDKRVVNCNDAPSIAVHVNKGLTHLQNGPAKSVAHVQLVRGVVVVQLEVGPRGLVRVAQVRAHGRILPTRDAQDVTEGQCVE